MPARDRRDAADHPHRRGLAGAVGPEEAERFAGRDVEVDGVDRGELAELLVRPRAWMSEGFAEVSGADTAGDTRVSGMGAHGTAARRVRRLSGRGADGPLRPG